MYRMSDLTRKAVHDRVPKPKGGVFEIARVYRDRRLRAVPRTPAVLLVVKRRANA